MKIAGRAFVGERDTEEIDRRLQEAHDQLALAQAARSVYTTLRSMHTTLLALRDSPADSPDGNARFLERHAVEVGRLSERIGHFAAVARDALDGVGGFGVAAIVRRR
ncbi:hypothetical protein ABZ840_21595 [Streptomyces sp. NPDC047117]|uniref:hypothetical protein n=1 Tax=Streptomyces sp. NPDC047117 TaxID=3155379 RepID=UPI0033DC57C8